MNVAVSQRNSHSPFNVDNKKGPVSKNAKKTELSYNENCSLQTALSAFVDELNGLNVNVPIILQGLIDVGSHEVTKGLTPVESKSVVDRLEATKNVIRQLTLEHNDTDNPTKTISLKINDQLLDLENKLKLILETGNSNPTTTTRRKKRGKIKRPSKTGGKRRRKKRRKKSHSKSHTHSTSSTAHKQVTEETKVLKRERLSRVLTLKNQVSKARKNLLSFLIWGSSSEHKLEAVVTETRYFFGEHIEGQSKSLHRWDMLELLGTVTKLMSSFVKTVTNETSKQAIIEFTETLVGHSATESLCEGLSHISSWCGPITSGIGVIVNLYSAYKTTKEIEKLDVKLKELGVETSKVPSKSSIVKMIRRMATVLTPFVKTGHETASGITSSQQLPTTTITLSPKDSEIPNENKEKDKIKKAKINILKNKKKTKKKLQRYKLVKALGFGMLSIGGILAITNPVGAAAGIIVLTTALTFSGLGISIGGSIATGIADKNESKTVLNDHETILLARLDQNSPDERETAIVMNAHKEIKTARKELEKNSRIIISNLDLINAFSTDKQNKSKSNKGIQTLTSPIYSKKKGHDEVRKATDKLCNEKNIKSQEKYKLVYKMLYELRFNVGPNQMKTTSFQTVRPLSKYGSKQLTQGYISFTYSKHASSTQSQTPKIALTPNTLSVPINPQHHPTIFA